MHDESLYARARLRAGASGYVMKQEAPELVLVAIRKVLKGEIFLSERISAELMNQLIGGRSTQVGSINGTVERPGIEVFGLIVNDREINVQLRNTNLKHQNQRESRIKLMIKDQGINELNETTKISQSMQSKSRDE